MKIYRHPLKGRHRFMGFGTGDKEVSISYLGGADLSKETMHLHEESDEILITAKGKATLIVEGKKIALLPGMPVKIEKGEKHMILSVDKLPFEIYAVKVPDKKDDKIIVEA